MLIHRHSKKALLYLRLPAIPLLFCLVVGVLGLVAVQRWFLQDEVRCRRFKGPGKHTHCLYRRTLWGISFSKKFVIGVSDVKWEKDGVFFVTFRGKVALPKHLFSSKSNAAHLKKKLSRFFKYWSREKVVRSQRDWKGWTAWLLVLVGFCGTLLFWDAVRFSRETGQLRSLRINLWVIRDDQTWSPDELEEIQLEEKDGRYQLFVLLKEGTKKPITPTLADGSFATTMCSELQEALSSQQEAVEVIQT